MYSLRFLKRFLFILPLSVVLAFGRCLLTDGLEIQPQGGIPVGTVVRQAAASAAQGWFLGCNAALKTQNEKFNAAQPVDCGSPAIHSGAEPFALYLTAARNAANEMIPIAQENKQFYYLESSLEACKSAAQTRAYLMTKIYLESTIQTGARADVLGPDDYAVSTLIGVTGAGQACFDAIKPTGRVISLGDLTL